MSEFSTTGGRGGHLHALMRAVLQTVDVRSQAIRQQVELVDRQIMALKQADRATYADQRGIAMALPPKVRLEPPAQVSSVKPAIAGLGVTASGDHRLGRF